MRISFRPLLFFALAVVLAASSGCDSGTPPNQVDEGGEPTVRFASSNVTVTENDSTVALPVALANPSGKPVSVEVLLALASGDMDFTLDDLNIDDPDPGNFRGGGNAYVIRTLEFDGDEADTALVEFTITDTLDTEDREVAVFALQNLQSEGDVTLGAPSELELSIGFPFLDEVRTRPLGADATVTGVVTRIAEGRSTYIQDPSAGFVIFGTSVAADFSRGDQIVATGEVEVFAGLLELGSISSYTVVSEENDLPAPQTVTLADIAADGEAYEAELLRVENLTFADAGGTFSAGTNYAVSDGTGGAVELRVPDGSFYAGQPIPEGPATFVSVLGQFNGEFDSITPNTGYQLLAVAEGDLQ